MEEQVELTMGDLFFFCFLKAKLCENDCSNRERTEVSRSHSSEEAFVMKVERRAESLKQVSFFFEVVKVNEEN